MVALLGTAEATIVPSVTFKCTPVPEDCDGWYQSDVAIEWTVLPSDAETTGCENRDFKTDIVTTVSCRAVDGSVSMTVDVEIKVDKTPPEVTGARPARSADVDGWYNHAVEVKFDGEDVTSGKGACTATTYGGPDSASATVEGRCFDKAGNVSKPLYYDLKYDETAPAVTAARTDRPPDYAGWYTAPVRLAVEATDATSGLAECPTVTYGGPDSATVSVIGTCRDQAGNVASRTFPLSFDATAPLLTRVAASGGDRRVMLRWLASGGAISAEVVRSPGRAGAPSSVVFRGAGAAFEDTRVVNGTRYTYEVRARDAAGNLGTRTVTAVPKPRLIAPAPGAVTQAGKPPVLRWTPVRRARYYNVQLFRGGRKLLSAWPARARFPLRRMWTHEGERVRLTPGEYKWIVWPGYGARAKSDYGERIGVRKFTVRAARR